MSRFSFSGRNLVLFRAALSVALALCIGAGTSLPAYAAGGQQGNLSGTVVDGATQKPVANASVNAVAPTGSYTAKTDGRGFFTILGLSVDTYTVSVQATGFEPISVSGVTIQGDQTVGMGNITVRKELRTIGRVTARSASSVFQPTQTIDAYAVSGAKILQTTGKAASTNENDLALAVPGVSLTNVAGAQGISIRGGLRTEVGYQYDGVNFTEPFFSQSASNGRFNGVGSLQVVEGAGDVSQGNIGGGVVNLVPKRGTNPPFGLVDFEAGGPNFFHQFAFEYGVSTPNGRYSDYFAYNGQRDAPYYGYHTSNAAAYNNYYGVSYEKNDDLVNNFIYKFGKNNSQALQILYLNRNLQQYGNLGGIVPPGGNNPTTFYPFDPSNALLANFIAPIFGPVGAAAYPKLVGLNPGVQLGQIYPNGGELATFNPTTYLKFEYDSNINSTTFLQARYYNWQTLQGTSNNTGFSGANPLNLGLGAYPTWNQTGGPRVGTTLDLTKQFGSQNTVTVGANYENAHPIWDGYDPNALVFLLGLQNLTGAPGPAYTDFLPGGYLYKFFPNGPPRIPNSGINYNKAWFQTFGYYVREQFAPNDRLRLDLGVRVDGQNQNYGLNPFNPTEQNNPSDVNPSGITAKFFRPRETEPRAAISYQAGRNDSFRFSYGRSVVFLNAQTAGTPAGMFNAGPFMSIPALPGFTCGSGKNPTYTVPCQNYAQQLYWLYDQNFDAPDLGAALPALYSNYDFSYGHQFKNGWGMRVTPFYKLGTNLPSFALVSSLAAGAAVFIVNNQGLNRTTGVEFGLNTPDVPFGFSGFFSGVYQNVLGSTPPLNSGEDALPINGSGSLSLGDVYRSGYVSPLSLRLGGEYKTKSGWRLAPVLQYDRGYPYSVGNTVASGSLINGVFQNIPQVNFGPGVTQIPGYQSSGGSAGTGQVNSTNYYDPYYSGTPNHPNIVATRGTPATSAAGGALWKPNLSANMVIEFKEKQNTFGVQLTNLFGNAYNGQVPVVNPYYQPVATGLSGPLTGVNPFAAGAPNRGFANIPHDAYAFSNGAYLLLPNRPMAFTFYYQLGL